MLALNLSRTALVIIDLQDGILPYAGGPYSAESVVNNAANLAAACRSKGIPVFLVRVGWSSDFADGLRQEVDQPNSGHPLPDNWWHPPVALAQADSDIIIIKRQWGAFYGTELELQLRRRSIETLLLCGISTNIGVESTARQAWELGFSLVVAEDACSAADSDQHAASMKYIMPRIARVRRTQQIIDAL